METQFQVADEQYLKDLALFAAELDLPNHLPEEEKVFYSWHAPWREESLQHYLALRWSMIAKNESGELLGFFLAQPLLFVRGLTQSLWIEKIIAVSDEVGQSLALTARKLAREKHFQAVLFAEDLKTESYLKGLSAQQIEKGIFQIRL